MYKVIKLASLYGQTGQTSRIGTNMTIEKNYDQY